MERETSFNSESFGASDVSTSLAGASGPTHGRAFAGVWACDTQDFELPSSSISPLHHFQQAAVGSFLYPLMNPVANDLQSLR